MHGYGFDGWGMPWGGGLLMILFWLTVIGLILWGLTSLLTSNKAAPQQPRLAPPPLEIAQARYARGDMSRDEYLALVVDLHSTDENVDYPKVKRSEL